MKVLYSLWKGGKQDTTRDYCWNAAAHRKFTPWPLQTSRLTTAGRCPAQGQALVLCPGVDTGVSIVNFFIDDLHNGTLHHQQLCRRGPGGPGEQAGHVSATRPILGSPV